MNWLDPNYDLAHIEASILAITPPKLFHAFLIKLLKKLCNNNTYHIVYCILYVYGEDNTRLKKLVSDPFVII
jgi:hypothetical protein